MVSTSEIYHNSPNLSDIARSYLFYEVKLVKLFVYSLAR